MRSTFARNAATDDSLRRSTEEKRKAVVVDRDGATKLTAEHMMTHFPSLRERTMALEWNSSNLALRVDTKAADCGAHMSKRHPSRLCDFPETPPTHTSTASKVPASIRFSVSEIAENRVPSCDPKL